MDSSEHFSRLLIDKNDVIEALTQLLEDYPSHTIPRQAVREALKRFAGSQDLSKHPSLAQLEEILVKAKSVDPH